MVLMSQDIMWEQFVSFSSLSHPPLLHPPPQAGPETTDSITSTLSFPTWLHYPMEPSRIPMSSALESLGWGWLKQGDSFFCGSKGLGEKPGSLASVGFRSDPLHCLSYFCWEGSLFLGQKLRKTKTLSVWFRRVIGFLKQNHHWSLTHLLLEAPPKSHEAY